MFFAHQDASSLQAQPTPTSAAEPAYSVAHKVDEDLYEAAPDAPLEEEHLEEQAIYEDPEHAAPPAGSGQGNVALAVFDYQAGQAHNETISFLLRFELFE